MSEPNRAAARRPCFVRSSLRFIARSIWRALRIMMIMMAAVGPTAPPPPLPRPASIEARADEGEGEGEES
jgi:hypothetical protein